MGGKSSFLKQELIIVKDLAKVFPLFSMFSQMTKLVRLHLVQAVLIKITKIKVLEGWWV